VSFFAGLSVFLVVLSAGVIRGWRWTFWLILVAFLAGILRIVPAALVTLGLTGTQQPVWYLAFQTVIGVVQFGIGLIMVLEYRRAGMWGGLANDP
jgi:hypothetical protein